MRSPPIRLVLVTDQFSCVRVSVVHIFRQVIVLRSPNHKNIAVALLLRQLFVSSVPRQSCYCISSLYLCCVQCLSSFFVLFLEVLLCSRVGEELVCTRKFVKSSFIKVATARIAFISTRILSHFPRNELL